MMPLKHLSGLLLLKKNQYEILQNEVGVLAVLPETTKQAIEQIVPIVVHEINIAYHEQSAIYE
ncbi:hypothetical protein MC5_07390 (plasmid) [Rickettsia australis str. Cutlack]|uniref:Uncharacterized protein n=2 Tax=Rickettsia australis TaxID=787 RepID=H8K9Y2_RICAC|nr:hypothetical protein MC5_07390 [Rickettsia australis str. Cutlack]